MKSYILSLLLLANLIRSPATDGKAVNDLALRIADVSQNGVLSVEMINVSSKPIRIWEESNSWGASHWRVLVVKKGQVQLYFQNPDRVFTANAPHYFEISSGDRTVRKLDLNSQNWIQDTNEPLHVNHGDIVIVLYDAERQLAWPESPASVEIANMNVWYGVCAASTTVH